MSIENIRPSSMVGIKRLAKSLKVERGIQHTQALDKAAQLAGFQNFRHASKLLDSEAKATLPRSDFQTFITVYWKDPKTNTDGRETLSIGLSEQWGDLITQLQLKNHRALHNFRCECFDHLERRYLVHSQSQARSEACAAVRTLQFMDATKLRPSKSHSRAFPKGRSSNAIPGSDHYSIWYDRDTKRYLFVDEPYEAAADSMNVERSAWAQQHGFVIEKPAWTGMYNPSGGSRLYLITDAKKGVSLEQIVVKLNQLPAPIVTANWNGESSPTISHFATPGSKKRSNVTKLKQKEPIKTSNRGNTIEYNQTLIGPMRRPKGKMPIEEHTKIGMLLKSVLAASYHRKGVYNRINSVRSELDEWVQREYNYNELPNEQFLNLYYHDSHTTDSRSIKEIERTRHIDSMNRAKQIMCKHYPDCPPLSSLVRKVDAAIKSMETWSS
jgi:hypothetical protein